MGAAQQFASIPDNHPHVYRLGSTLEYGVLRTGAMLDREYVEERSLVSIIEIHIPAEEVQEGLPPLFTDIIREIVAFLIGT
jgi:hypothetical protein